MSEDRDELVPERDPEIASVLRYADDGEPPFDAVDWTALHAQVMNTASARLRALRQESPLLVLARWARPVLPGAMAASAVLVLLLTMVTHRETTRFAGADSAAAPLDAAAGFAAENPTLAGVLAGDDQAILDAALAGRVDASADEED